MRAAPNAAAGSKIFGDFLELVDRAPLLARQRSDGVLETVVEVVLDQRALGLRDRLLDGVKLLGDVEAFAPGFDHLHDAAQVSLGALQAPGDPEMARMRVGMRMLVCIRAGMG